MKSLTQEELDLLLLEHDCTGNRLDLSNMNLSGLTFKDLNCSSIDFGYSDLTNAIFDNVFVNSITLDSTILIGVDLSQIIVMYNIWCSQDPIFDKDPLVSKTILKMWVDKLGFTSTKDM